MLISTVEEVIGVREVVPPIRKAWSTRLGGESADRGPLDWVGRVQMGGICVKAMIHSFLKCALIIRHHTVH